MTYCLKKSANTVFLFDSFEIITNRVSIHACLAHANIIPIILHRNQNSILYIWLETRAIYILWDQRDSSSCILLFWCGKKNGSGCQAAGIEASVSLRLLTDVVLNVEFRFVRVVAFFGLQIPETRADQLFGVYQSVCQSYIHTVQLLSLQNKNYQKKIHSNSIKTSIWFSFLFSF